MYQYTLASDLHVDTGHWGPGLETLTWEKNILLAGDLGGGLGNFDVVKKLKAKGHKVFAVDGNHEHYDNALHRRTLQETEDLFYEKLGAIFRVPGGRQRQVVMLRDDLFLIGCNGWYVIDDADHWELCMNDSRYGALRAEVVNDAARRHAELVDTALAKLPAGAQAIVVTHTAPCAESLDPQYAGQASNAYFWNPLMERVMRAHHAVIKVWHHGHTHARVDLEHAGVHVIANPRGYPGEVRGWRPLSLEA